MKTYFETKITYEKVDERTGKEKRVAETYLVDAITFGEAEARIVAEFAGYNIVVLTIKRANYTELRYSDNASKWFKCKVEFIAVNEERGIETKVAQYYLIQADNSENAIKEVHELFNSSISNYEIPQVVATPILEVYEYKNNEEYERRNSNN